MSETRAMTSRSVQTRFRPRIEPIELDISDDLPCAAKSAALVSDFTPTHASWLN